MLHIPRLRDVLKKLETTSHLAKYFIKRATVVVGGAINKEYGAPTSSNNFPSLTSSSSSSQTVTSHLDSLLSSPLFMSMTTSMSEKLGNAIGTEIESPGTRTRARTTEIKLMYTEQEKQLKKIKAALLNANASLFSKTVSSGSVVELVSNCKNLREQSVLNQKYNKNGEENLSTTAKQNQSSRNMSEAKVKEVTLSAAQDKEEANTKQLGEKVSCNGASCGSGTADQERPEHNGKEKSCFKGSLADILHFMELVGNLKHTKRTGWVLRDVNDCESISGHMYRMSMMTFLLEENEGLDRVRCMELALVHDLAESLVGDLTPFCGVAKEDKKAMELKAMADICDLLKPRGKRIMELFEEYEEGESAESKFVKDLDRLDMVMQAFEYEKRDNCLMKHQEFFDSTEGKFQHPFVQKLVKEICDQRKSLVEAKLVAKGGDINLKTVTPNCPPCLEHKNERS